MPTPTADRRSFLVGLGALSAGVVAVTRSVFAQADGEVAWVEHLERAHYASEPYQGDAFTYIAVTADYGLCERVAANATAARGFSSPIAGVRIPTGDFAIPSPPWASWELAFALTSLRLKGAYKGVTPKDLAPTWVDLPSRLQSFGDQSPGEYNHYCEALKAQRCERAKAQQAQMERAAAAMALAAGMYGSGRTVALAYPALARAVPPITIAGGIAATLSITLGYAAFSMRYMVEEVCRTEACA